MIQGAMQTSGGTYYKVAQEVSKLQAQVKGLPSPAQIQEILLLDGRVDTLETDTGQLISDMTTAQGQITNLQSDLGTQTGRIDVIETYTQSLELTKIPAMDQDIAQALEQLNDLNTTTIPNLQSGIDDASSLALTAASKLVNVNVNDIDAMKTLKNKMPTTYTAGNILQTDGTNYINKTKTQAGVQTANIGIIDNTKISASYSTPRLTLTISEGFAYINAAGEYKTIAASSPWFDHVIVGGNYYCYISSDVIVFSSSPWNILTDVPLYYVIYNEFNNNGILFKETHQNTMSATEHYYLHQTQGTKLLSGCVLQTSVDITWTMTSGQIMDEDLIIDTAAVVNTSYRVAYLRGIQAQPQWVYVDNSNHGIHHDGTNPYYNQLSGGNWNLASITSNDYFNYWVMATPSYNAPQIIVLMGQSTYATATLAQAATVNTELSGLNSFAEGVILYRITYQRTVAGAYTNTNRIAVSQIGQSITQIMVGSTISANNVINSTTNFTNLLSSSDGTVQQALDTIDTKVSTLTAPQTLVMRDVAGHVQSTGITLGDSTNLAYVKGVQMQGTNISGYDTMYQGSQPTGTGAGGKHVFQTQGQGSANNPITFSKAADYAGDVIIQGITRSCTCSIGNILVVFTLERTCCLSGMTYAGAAMTLHQTIGYMDGTGSNVIRIWLNYAPASGTNNLILYSGWQDAVNMVALSVGGYDATTPISDIFGTLNPGLTASQTMPTNIKDIQFDFVVYTNGRTITPGAGQTMYFQVGYAPPNLRSQLYYKEATQTSTTTTYSVNGDTVGVLSIVLRSGQSGRQDAQQTNMLMNYNGNIETLNDTVIRKSITCNQRGEFLRSLYVYGKFFYDGLLQPKFNLNPRMSVYWNNTDMSLKRGWANTVFGMFCGLNLTGDSNTVFGYNSLTTATTAIKNTVIGFNNWWGASTVAQNNTIVGNTNFQTNTSFGNCTIIGNSNLNNSVLGVNNVVCGSQNGADLLGGSSCLFLGNGHMSNGVMAGDFSTAVGNNCRFTLNSTNEIVIGHTLQGKGTNTTIIGGSAGCYQQNNQPNFSTSSDARIKKNIVPAAKGLSEILQLSVKNYEYKRKEETEGLINYDLPEGLITGMIAQEVQTVFPECVKSNADVLSIDYHYIHMTNIRAVQQLAAQNEALQRTVSGLVDLVNAQHCIGELFLSANGKLPVKGNHVIHICDGTLFDIQLYPELYQTLNANQLPLIINPSSNLSYYIIMK